MSAQEPRPRLAELATELLASEHVASVSVDPSAEAATIALMATRIEAEGRKRRLARAATVLSLAAAIALAVSGAWIARHRGHDDVARAPAPVAPPAQEAPKPLATALGIEGDAVVVHDGREAKLDAETPLAEGDRVIARADGRASVRLATGTRLGIEPGSDVAIVHQGLLQMFALDAGSIRADVAKLHADERFVVETKDAEIEVRGTSFRVSAGAPDACSGTETRVDVDEGTVVVRSGGKESRVTAGEHWPADCVTKTAAARPHRRGRAAPRELTAEEESELRAQTALFGDAIAAKKRGDARAAAARFDDYLARYPDSALAEAAAAQRFEVLASFDPPRAADAARAYLQRWPNGARRDEAAAIVAGKP